MRFFPAGATPVVGCFALTLITGLAQAKTTPSITVSFPGASFTLSGQDTGLLSDLAAQGVSDHTLIFNVDSYTGGLKISSQRYIIARTRTLKIMQVLVKQGVDAGHVQIDEKPTGKGTNADILAVTTTSRPDLPAVPKLRPDPSAKPGSDTFVLTFASASAVPLMKDQEAFHAFLKGVGQPGHDALTIEGHTDSTGSAEYNKALAELRALSVYETLVRAGTPPYRIETRGVTSSEGVGAKDSAAQKQAARSVTIRWIKDSTVASAAAAVEQSAAPITPPPPPPPVPPPPPPPIEEAAKATPATQAMPPASDTKALELVTYYGLAFAGGEMQHKVKPAATYGLGLDSEFWSTPAGKARATLEGGATKLAARPAGLTGPMRMMYGLLRLDYVFKTPFAQPFVGVGAGYYRWKVDVTELASGANNSGDKHDGGFLLAAGLDIPVASFLVLAPEVTWNRIYGTFNEQLWTVWLPLRWALL